MQKLLSDISKGKLEDSLCGIAFKHIPAALALSDLETGKLVAANEYFMELVGYPLHILLGKTSQDLGLWPNWAHRNFLVNELEKHGTLRNREVLLRTAHRGILNILASFEHVQIGEREYVLGMAVDITERKRAAEKQEEAIAMAEAANQAKSTFLANMSHELRTPLTAVSGFTQLLHHLFAKDGSPDKAQVLQYLERIRRNTQHLENIVNDVLDLSKVESGKLEIQRLTFDLKEEVQNVIANFSEQARAKGISLMLEYDSTAPVTVETDPQRLNQVLTNLIANAIRFTSRGSILVAVRADNKLVELCVQDSGEGMDESKHKEIFEMFVQADSSISRKYGGTGLGLPISRKLARLMGGDVQLLWSTPGLGSVFSFTFAPGENAKFKAIASPPKKTPDVLPAQNKLPRTPQKGVQRLLGKKVLVVEDGTDNRELLAYFLKQAGASVSTAVNGQQGVDIAVGNNFDVVLMDVHMPGLDGYQATELLRERGCQIPVLAVTAAAMKDPRQDKSVFSAYLTKPFNSNDLVDAISTLCSH